MLDKDMREPLFDFLDDWYGKIRVIEEKTILSSRADVLGVIDGAIIGIELKSDHDTYQRLKTQIRDYEKVCDYCYAAVGQSHVKHIAEHIPDYWGILVVTDEDTYLMREAEENPNLVMKAQIALMWRRELDMLLQKNELPKYKGRSKAFVEERLLALLPLSDLKRQMTDLIFERDYTIFEQQPKATFRSTKSGIKVRRKSSVKRKKTSDSIKKDRERAHTTHYIAGRKRKKSVSRKNT